MLRPAARCTMSQWVEECSSNHGLLEVGQNCQIRKSPIGLYALSRTLMLIPNTRYHAEMIGMEPLDCFADAGFVSQVPAQLMCTVIATQPSKTDGTRDRRLLS